LRVASVPYGWGVAIRNRLFDRGWRAVESAGVPVVSVGNLTVGGTGKTPAVEYIARRLLQWNRRVAILSRGYATLPPLLSGERGRGEGLGCQAFNDEALVLAENLPGVPHLQGADRVAIARKAVQELRSDVLVLDDGFQHRRLARNLDIVILDATQPWGFGYLLPRGLLREAPRGLERADVVLLTRCDQESPTELDRLQADVSKIVPQVPVAITSHQPAQWVNADGETKALEQYRGRRIAAFCGIGNPEAFRRTLTNLGMMVEAFRCFPDHHAYTPADVVTLGSWARQNAREGVVVTTQKDLVKLRLTRLGECELWALRIQLHIHAGEDALDLKLKEALG
jgi:tetraacyldisaccharide 4'-kinase